MLNQFVKKHIPLMTGILRHVHSRHFPNDIIEISHPKPEDYDQIKNQSSEQWPFYGGRITVQKKKRQMFPQRKDIIDKSPLDIRSRQRDTTLRFGGNPRTYPTLLVYPDGSTLTVPYHKPVGTLYLPGDEKRISIDAKPKGKPKRRIKVGVR